MVKAPAHTKRVPFPKVLLEEGRIFLRKEFEHGSHLTLYHNGYVWFSAGKRNTVFHIHDCRGDYAYGASKGKGEVIKEEYFENCEWHIGAYDITADELLAGTDTAKTESKTAQAQMLILELLADGKRMPSAELEKAVNERGISSRTMRTAKSRIGDRLVTEKDGTAWVCYLRD